MTNVATGDKYWYHYNGSGSVVALSKYNTQAQQAEIVERYKYDEFGNTTVTLNGNTGNPYRYTGRRWDDETGLYYYRARMYSPAIGRFLQTDPLGYYDSMNMYTYVNNNPLNWTDPWGLASIKARPVAKGFARMLANLFYGKGDRRGKHWHIFYEDGTNSGYMGDKLSGWNDFRSDNKMGYSAAPKSDYPTVVYSPAPESQLARYNETIVSNLDDQILRDAESIVQRKWKRDQAIKGVDSRKYNHPDNDCQSYILEVLSTYNKLMQEEKTDCLK